MQNLYQAHQISDYHIKRNENNDLEKTYWDPILYVYWNPFTNDVTLLKSRVKYEIILLQDKTKTLDKYEGNETNKTVQK
jgi:hypothetical protein